MFSYYDLLMFVTSINKLTEDREIRSKGGNSLTYFASNRTITARGMGFMLGLKQAIKGKSNFSVLFEKENLIQVLVDPPILKDSHAYLNALEAPLMYFCRLTGAHPNFYYNKTLKRYSSVGAKIAGCIVGIRKLNLETKETWVLYIGNKMLRFKEMSELIKYLITVKNND